VDRKIILISKKAEDQEFARQVAETSEIPLSVFGTPAEAVAAAKSSTRNILFADISSDEQFNEFTHELQQLIGTGANQISPNLVHFISSESLEKMKVLAHSNVFGHFILRRYGNPKESGAYYGRILQNLCNNQAFGLENLLSSKGSVHIMKISHSMEKKKVLESISNYLLKETSFRDRMADVMITAVDELLMNAIYDAPADDKGNQQMRNLARNTPLPLDGKSSVELQMGFDGEYVAFTVIDRFGTLNKAKLLKHLSASHEADHLVDQIVLNAGIGLATTFRTGGSLVFVSEPGVRTEVTTFFKQTASYKEFRNQFRFISIHVGS
jgi:hypothetical protein